MQEIKTNKKARVVGEIVDRRDEFHKFYRMSDGSIRSILYPEAVHAYDCEANRYEDIDTTFIEESGGKYFRNTRSNFDVRFSCDESDDELFSMEKDGHVVKVYAKRSKKQHKEPAVSHLHRRNENNTSEKGKDTLIFENIIDETDYEYLLNGSGVKENIIVKARSNVYRYSFILECKNVIPEFIEGEKMVVFKDVDNDKEIFNIPAPFMKDASGEISTDVVYELRSEAENTYVFTVTADSEWVNDEERAFPVIVDPQINISGSTNITAYRYSGGTPSSTTGNTYIGKNSGGTVNRTYMKIYVPPFRGAPYIKSAELKLNQSNAGSACSGQYFIMYAYTSESDMLADNEGTPIDFNVMKTASENDNKMVTYTFNLHPLIDKSGYYYLGFKLDGENNAPTNSLITLYGTGNTNYAPQLCMTYDNAFEVDMSNCAQTYELGRFGTYGVDLRTGNFMLESTDFEWGGSRMPITIKHLFNSHYYIYRSCAYQEGSDIDINYPGLGFRLNLMQTMKPHRYDDNGTMKTVFTYTDETGREIDFKAVDDTGLVYKDVDGAGYEYISYERKLTIGSQIYLFNADGCLVRITDEYGNYCQINYDSKKRISSVIDGAGREFGFAYSGDYLASITAPDNTSINYTYSGSKLSEIRYPDGRCVKISCDIFSMKNITLCDSEGNVEYYIDTTYKRTLSGNESEDYGTHTTFEVREYKISTIREYGVDSSGNTVLGKTYSYNFAPAKNRTQVTVREPADASEGESSDTVLTTVYTFDDDGNISDEYTVKGTTPANLFAVDSDRPLYNSTNLLLDHDFNEVSNWTGELANCDGFERTVVTDEEVAYFGTKCMKMASFDEYAIDNGVYQDVTGLAKGKYTFSAYVRVCNGENIYGPSAPGAFIRVTDADGNTLGESEHVYACDSEYVRLIVPFEQAIEGECSVTVHILMNGKGSVYVDGAQLEDNPFVSGYNMLVNGDFRESGSVGGLYVAYDWVKKDYEPEDGYYASDSLIRIFPAVDEETSIPVMNMQTKPHAHDIYICQTVDVKKSASAKESFTFSGWMKSDTVVRHISEDSSPTAIALRAEVLYKDKTTEDFWAYFYPTSTEWQKASLQFEKSREEEITNIKVYCHCMNGMGTYSFAKMQLTRNNVGDFEDESSYGGSSAEEYNSEGPFAFEEVRDAYGNALTSTVSSPNVLGTIYTSTEYNSECYGTCNAGNDVIAETDSRGFRTDYTVDEETSRNERVRGRSGYATDYEYDENGRTTKVISRGEYDSELARVEYKYDNFDNLTEIARGDGMKYDLTYNEFHNLAGIGVRGEAAPLIQNEYKNGNGRLKAVSYANGHKMKLTYNSSGQVTDEKWFDPNGSLASQYKYVYDGEGNVVRSIDIFCKKEYNYYYENEVMTRSTESDITLDASQIVTSKVVINTVLYTYDKNGNLTRKKIVPTNGKEQVFYYETAGEKTVTGFERNGVTVTSRSKTDDLGRKEFDEIQTGTQFFFRKYDYVAGHRSSVHEANGKLRSVPTTELVSKITYWDGNTIEYEYDAEERITKVIDSVEGITEYTYDALGQLLTEKKNGTYVNTMVYDNYGNIVAKNGKIYTYNCQDGSDTWRDLLTAYDGCAIIYDGQGNPTTYLGRNLEWEKGRQLKSIDGDKFFTYNANGIRTSKTVWGSKHTYTLEGTKILREEWNGGSITPIYDNEDSVCGIIYDNGSISRPYYFDKNLQGDVIGIVDENGFVVARYSYDAWGKCTIVSDTSGINIAFYNPFRYRGYYYDKETGFYYLQSRYYDPETGRFINGDIPEILASSYLTNHIDDFNIFVYCRNNPIMNLDSFGYSAVSEANWLIDVLFGSIMALKLSGAALATKVSAMILAIAPYLIWIVVAVAAVVVTYYIARNAVVSKADSKIRKTVRKNSKARYWTATVKTYYVDIGRELTYSQAVKEVAAGRSVFTVTWYEAKAVALAAGGTTGRNNKALYPEIDKGKENIKGYYWHYHTYNRKGGHVYYLF